MESFELQKVLISSTEPIDIPSTSIASRPLNLLFAKNMKEGGKKLQEPCTLRKFSLFSFMLKYSIDG
ncbi:MAG: hypothetical protein L0H53_12570 [Candidatus Nitrosocosmicus sp.]|nr:hypothetical protein [Candidatus Nitrosocosmicus sp.]MDN5867942.1 hypothetical protein [Candidatus Nitrosocosmicus sp.]